MTPWKYKGKVIQQLEDLPNHENLAGFVYCITHIKTGKIYIGKKALFHKKKTRISKREKTATKTRATFKRTVKDSGWLNYWGSCAPLKEDLKLYGEEAFTREILELACNKKYLTYCEFAYQVKLDVLKTNSYNGNILSRYFSKDMENCT